jgi:hypothetical protein
MENRVIVDVIRRPEYLVGYEPFGGATFIHVRVYRWSAAIARRFRDDIDTAHKLLGLPVYVIDNPDVPTLRHFLSLHGFEECGCVVDTQGRLVNTFGRPIDGQPLAQWSPY